MTNEKLIELYYLLLLHVTHEENPSRNEWLTIGAIYGELKERGYEVKEA